MKPQANGQPVKVEPDYLYTEIASAHNIVINEESGFAYAVGSSAGGTTCGGGLHMIDIREPKKPKFAGCFADNQTGRARHGLHARRAVRDLQGPGQALQGPRDLHRLERDRHQRSPTSPTRRTPKAFSRAGYPERGVHAPGLVHRRPPLLLSSTTRATRRRGVGQEDAHADLGPDRPREPELAKEHIGVRQRPPITTCTSSAIYMYQANYKSGLRILNIKDPREPEGSRVLRHRAVQRQQSGLPGRVEHLSVLQERRDRREQHRAGAVPGEAERPADSSREIAVRVFRATYGRGIILAAAVADLSAHSQPQLLYVCVQDDAKIAVVDMAKRRGRPDDRPRRRSASPPPPSRTSSSSSRTARTGTCR